MGLFSGKITADELFESEKRPFKLQVRFDGWWVIDKMEWITVAIFATLPIAKDAVKSSSFKTLPCECMRVLYKEKVYDVANH